VASCGAPQANGNNFNFFASPEANSTTFNQKLNGCGTAERRDSLRKKYASPRRCDVSVRCFALPLALRNAGKQP